MDRKDANPVSNLPDDVIPDPEVDFYRDTPVRYLGEFSTKFSSVIIKKVDKIHPVKTGCMNLSQL